ncbi:MAG: hypothetical protein Q7O66_22210 [Dehalococcoidia bacterium]|nr:hypothetical protein [Dehalococcoidia bacterium]
MAGKQHLKKHLAHGRRFIRLPKRQATAWILLPSFLLALVFLSFMFMKGPTGGATSIDKQDLLAPIAANGISSGYVDRPQMNESYLPFRPVLR